MVIQTQPAIMIDVTAMVKEVLKERIGNTISDINLPTIMSLKHFCKLNDVSHNFVMEHKDEFCVIKIGGKVLINLVAWREKLKQGVK